MILYGHPFSSYTWKALIPLYEKALPFDFHSLSDESANHYGALTELWSACPVANGGYVRLAAE